MYQAGKLLWELKQWRKFCLLSQCKNFYDTDISQFLKVTATWLNNVIHTYIHMCVCVYTQTHIFIHICAWHLFLLIEIIDQTHTWLPSLLQKIAGWGFPVASHWKVTVRPKATTWSRGFTTKCGGSKEDETNYTGLKACSYCLNWETCWHLNCCHYLIQLVKDCSP